MGHRHSKRRLSPRAASCFHGSGPPPSSWMGGSIPPHDVSQQGARYRRPLPPPRLFLLLLLLLLLCSAAAHVKARGRGGTAPQRIGQKPGHGSMGWSSCPAVTRPSGFVCVRAALLSDLCSIAARLYIESGSETARRCRLLKRVGRHLPCPCPALPLLRAGHPCKPAALLLTHTLSVYSPSLLIWSSNRTPDGLVA